MQEQRCYNCHQWVRLLFVHSHYQCPVCGRNLLPCCEGEILDECISNKNLAGSNDDLKKDKQ